MACIQDGIMRESKVPPARVFAELLSVGKERIKRIPGKEDEPGVREEHLEEHCNASSHANPFYAPIRDASSSGRWSEEGGDISALCGQEFKRFGI
jgi:hypothetical protein